MSTDGGAFSAYNSTTTDDYYAFLPSSDESMSDAEDVPFSAPIYNPVEDFSSTSASSTNSIQSRADVLAPTSRLNPSIHTDERPKPTRKQGNVPLLRAVNPGGKNNSEPNVSIRHLARHHARKTQLEDALDTALGGKLNGEVPFRFAKQHNERIKDEVEEEISKASPARGIVPKVEKCAPEKKHLGRRRPVSGREERKSEDESDEDERFEPDPLFDKQLDDADKQWVQNHFRGALSTQHETDATLCCPCCFLTVCMICERHITYTNQYRATTAINCRVKRDDILTYTSSGSGVPASMPFHMRKNVNAGNGRVTVASTPGREIAMVLQADEFYAVVCSDCGTMVGVFDQDQHYHFFNALPSIS
uniref:E2F-associated phosphoprotein n=1 Tax=Peronospora matthiolae TaxID=2874970 RepID=A0AAV1TQ02_9STRA